MATNDVTVRGNDFTQTLYRYRRNSAIKCYESTGDFAHRERNGDIFTSYAGVPTVNVIAILTTLE